MAKSKTVKAGKIKRAVDKMSAADQEIINLKCTAYNVNSAQFKKGEFTIAKNLVNEFGADKLSEWYRMAYDRDVDGWDAILYVCGIAKKVRKQKEEGTDGIYTA